MCSIGKKWFDWLWNKNRPQRMSPVICTFKLLSAGFLLKEIIPWWLQSLLMTSRQPTEIEYSDSGAIDMGYPTAHDFHSQSHSMELDNKLHFDFVPNVLAIAVHHPLAGWVKEIITFFLEYTPFHSKSYWWLDRVVGWWPMWIIVSAPVQKKSVFRFNFEMSIF